MKATEIAKTENSLIATNISYILYVNIIAIVLFKTEFCFKTENFHSCKYI